MITSIHISNYAIIDHIELSLKNGLTAITGETGAGKSILLGALGLVLGNRADSQVLYDNTKKCVVEAIFNIKDYQLQDVFQEEDLDYEEQCIIRREINIKGKSRAFINDTPTNLSTLRKIASNLVDLHQQFDTLEINQEAFQIEILDALGDHLPVLSKYNSLYQEYLLNLTHLEELKSTSEDAAKEFDFIQFQAEELEKLNLETGEYSTIEQEFQRIQNSEEIKLVGQKISEALDGGEYSMYNSLTDLYKSVEKLADFDAQASSITNRLYSIREEITDISKEAVQMEEGAEYDGERMKFLEERLNEINRLFNKHRVQSDKELIDIKNALNQKLESFINLDEEIKQLENKIGDQQIKLENLAGAITKARKENAEFLDKAVKNKLEELSMPNAVLNIKVQPASKLRKTGKDMVHFMFTANKGGQFLPLQNVASGGELSRLNLAIKSIVAGAITLPSLIFDEIDTGVSGNVSLRMGKLIKSLAKNHQTIVITHSPQIAALADHHLFIYKYDEESRTKTKMKVLKEDEKIVEIAKMLSGDPPTQAALKNAEDLIALK